MLSVRALLVLLALLWSSQAAGEDIAGIAPGPEPLTKEHRAPCRKGPYRYFTRTELAAIHKTCR